MSSSNPKQKESTETMNKQFYLMMELKHPSIPNEFVDKLGYYRIEQVTENYEFYPHILHAIVTNDAMDAIASHFLSIGDKNSVNSMQPLEFNNEDSESLIPDDIIYHYYQI